MTQRNGLTLGDILFDHAVGVNRAYLAGMANARALNESTATDPRLELDTPPLTLEDRVNKRMEKLGEAIKDLRDPDKVESSGNNIVEQKIMETVEALDAVSDPAEVRFQNAVSDARAAFWLQLKSHYPEIPDTAVMTDREIEARFEISTEGAADAWLDENAVQVLDSKGGEA